MKTNDRSAQITKILTTISSSENADLSAELETYIADLESKQPDRPARITSILRTIRSHYPADMGISLDAYISNLEAHQQVQGMDEEEEIVEWDPNNPPIWSHHHAVERDQQRRERAQNKIDHNYQ